MQLLTADGYRPVSTRAEFVEGVYQGQTSWVPLVPRPSGELLAATYEQLYRRNPWVYTCVQIRMRGLSMLPINTYQLLAGGGRVRIRGDLPNTPGRFSDPQRLDRLMRNPRALVDRATFWRRVIKDYSIRGNVLLEKERDPMTGKILSLRFWPWRSVVPVRLGAVGYGGVFYGQEGPILHYNVTEPGTMQTRALMPSDVVHLRAGDSEDGELGVSPLEPIAAEMAIHDAVNRQVKGWFGNGANPSLIARVNTRPKPDDLNFLQEQFRQGYGGPENTGKVIFSTVDVSPLKTSDSNTPQAVEIARVSREAVLAVFGVPPPLAGVLDKSIHSTIKDLRSWWLRDLIGPLTDEVEGQLMAQLVNDASEPNWTAECLLLEFDFDQRLKPDLTDLAVALQRLTTSGIWTPNEGRDYVGKEPSTTKEADEVWMPVNAAPISAHPVGKPKGLPTPGPSSSGDGA